MEINDKAMLEVKNLRKRFGGFEAVKGVSFTVSPGEVLGFLGPNGAGKSTTMRMITGFLPPTAGTAVIDGHDIQSDPIAAKAALARAFAARTGAVIAITGAIDLVADADRCCAIRNGTPRMGTITGTGCQLSGMTAAYLAAIDGHGQEDLFYGYDRDDAPTPTGETDYLLSYLHRSQQAGKRILGAAFDGVYLDIVDAFEEFEG